MGPSPPAPFSRILVVGDGGWGTALALVLCDLGRKVALWAHDPDYARILIASRSNPRYLAGFPIPPPIQISSEITELLDGVDLVISAVPTAYLRAVWSALAPLVPPGIPILTVSKGLEQESLQRPSELLRAVTGSQRPLAVLSGPNIAREIARGLPAAAAVAADPPDLVARLQSTFAGERFRIYSNADLAGVELGGALKNVIALAAGMCDGLELGDNAKATLLTRGILEMARLGEAFGGRRETFFGLAGLGDLITTCMSPLSRNRTFGERVGRGERVEDILASTRQVAEGVRSARAVLDLMDRHRLRMPISLEVHRVLYEGRSPRDSVRSLMTRTPRDESE